MRRFSSYGPLNTKRHYYAPRKELIERGIFQLLGENSNEDGHYITIWAPRQCGKTWVMQEVTEKIRQTDEYEVGILPMQSAKEVKDEKKVLEILVEKLQQAFKKKLPRIKAINDLPGLFTEQYLVGCERKPKEL